MHSSRTTLAKIQPVSDPDDESPDRMEAESADEAQNYGVSIESLKAVSGAVDRVNHLGIAIRQSSVRTQSKVRGYQEGFDLVSFEEVAHLALETLYPDANEKLIIQLSRSMTETFAHFIRRKTQHGALQERRERSRPPPTLSIIDEEPSDAGDGTSSMEFQPSETPRKGENPISRSWRHPPPPVRQQGIPVPSEKPSSLDSREVRRTYEKMVSPSIAGKAKSILVSHVDYPRPPKGSLQCQWCFCSLGPDALGGPKWQ